MLTLYHAGNSVCSIKARLALEEAETEWTSAEIDLGAGEQFAPDYLRLNRAGVVPTLIDGDRVLTESSIIIDYVCSIATNTSLIPADPYEAARARHWGLRGLAMHAAVNTVSFASFGRLGLLKKSPEEREQFYAQMPDPEAATKRRDLVDNGVASPRVGGAMRTLRTMVKDIDTQLAGRPWLAGAEFSLADIAVAAYVYRSECVGLSTLWSDLPEMTEWWARLRARPAWDRTVGPWVNEALLARMDEEGRRAFDGVVADYLAA